MSAMASRRQKLPINMFSVTQRSNFLPLLMLKEECAINTCKTVFFSFFNQMNVQKKDRFAFKTHTHNKMMNHSRVLNHIINPIKLTEPNEISNKYISKRTKKNKRKKQRKHPTKHTTIIYRPLPLLKTPPPPPSPTPLPPYTAQMRDPAPAPSPPPAVPEQPRGSSRPPPPPPRPARPLNTLGVQPVSLNFPMNYSRRVRR